MTRDHVLQWLFRKLGFSQYEILPLWARLLVMAIHPSKIATYMAARVYDWESDTMIVNGARFSRHWVEGLRDLKLPTPWYRLKGWTDYGTPIVECRVDQQEETK